MMEITIGLLSLGSTLSAILEARAALVVLRAGRRESPELEVPLVEDAVAINRCLVAGARAHGQHQVYHHAGRLPLARRYARIQVGVRGLEQGLPHVGSGTRAGL